MSLTGQITRVHATKLGIPKLTIQIAIENQFDASLAILAVNAEVRAGASVQQFDVMQTSKFLGYAVLESCPGQIAKGGKTSWQIGLPLSQHHLQKNRRRSQWTGCFAHRTVLV